MMTFEEIKKKYPLDKGILYVVKLNKYNLPGVELKILYNAYSTFNGKDFFLSNSAEETVEANHMDFILCEINRHREKINIKSCELTNMWYFDNLDAALQKCQELYGKV